MSNCIKCEHFSQNKFFLWKRRVGLQEWIGGHLINFDFVTCRVPANRNFSHWCWSFLSSLVAILPSSLLVSPFCCKIIKQVPCILIKTRYQPRHWPFNHRYFFPLVNYYIQVSLHKLNNILNFFFYTSWNTTSYMKRHCSF